MQYKHKKLQAEYNDLLQKFEEMQSAADTLQLDHTQLIVRHMALQHEHQRLKNVSDSKLGV